MLVIESIEDNTSTAEIVYKKMSIDLIIYKIIIKIKIIIIIIIYKTKQYETSDFMPKFKEKIKNVKAMEA